ncbi:cytochrome c3 family protein [Mucilaginibacter endophyticus]|uniref:cytochrome c3 family protein n=1 Tax=Mucilaginibacter endophyticus TaxID=2675003 RepID=UPI000E0D71C6|nr:cytochrome c3 family protein [Mucilaginibacter endophyticus]
MAAFLSLYGGVLHFLVRFISNIMLKQRTFFLALLLLIPLSFLLVQCFSDKPQDPRAEIFAGSASCEKCHKDVYNSYLHTAHYLSSRPTSAEIVHGSFDSNRNTLQYADGTVVKMEKRNGELYQVSYTNNKETVAHKMDITFGVNKAQTYMYWQDKQLFELPVSYFNTVHGWANSPGYDGTKPDFNRPILQRCFECHASFIRQASQQNIDLQNRKIEFEPASIIYGIDCERCHGPAANHVNYHEAYPEEKTAKYITRFASLTRAQKMDACGVCHSSSKQAFQLSTFKFKMGDTLARFKEPDYLNIQTNAASLDVHGNQNGLLTASKCYLMSNMDCSTCHNTHVNNGGNLALYSKKCMSCHTEANHNLCKVAPKLSAMMQNNCIDCHMPLKPSNTIAVNDTSGKSSSPYLVRTHRIAIYPNETKKILAFLNTAGK